MEGEEGGRGNTEGENEKEDERETEEDGVYPHPHILGQTVPELEALFDRLEIEEESAHADVSEHSQH